jgi:hypothetical protein
MYSTLQHLKLYRLVCGLEVKKYRKEVGRLLR